jgi:hypothetical protein
MPRVPDLPRPLRFMIEDRSQADWSKLVEEWIRNPSKWPTTFPELCEQCDAREILYNHPDNMSEEVHFLQKGKNVMTVRLPALALFEAGQALIETSRTAGADVYKLPDFYNDFFADGSQRKGLDKANALRLHRLRTGEYAINGCA